MKYVIVPEDLTIVDQKGKPVLVKHSEELILPWLVTHFSFVGDHLCGNAELVKGSAGMRRQRKLLLAFEDAKPGDVVGVEDADYPVAAMACTQLDFAPAFARYASQLLPFVEAWEAAEKQDDAWKKKYDAAKQLGIIGLKEVPAEKPSAEA